MDEYQFMSTDPQETDPCDNDCTEQGTSHPTTSAGEPTDAKPPVNGIK